MLKSHWYHLLFAACLLTPALICQSAGPAFVASATWESLSEDLYASLLRFQTPPVAQPGRVVVLEADKKTIDRYGWPIDRAYYIKALAKLKGAGHPWVLSLLNFQALAKARADAPVKAQRGVLDKGLADAIQGYQRYVGTGLTITPGAELDADQEDKLLPRITLTRDGNQLEDLPRLPLSLSEDEPFVNGQRAFGFGTHFGTEPMIHCMQMYLTDAQQTGAFVIPSSLVWVAAYATEAQILTATGASWPRLGEGLPFAFKNKLKISYKECLTSPGVPTRAFLAARGVQRLSLVDFLERSANLSLAGKVVLLAGTDMRRFRGPGVAAAGDDGIVEEQLLAARFLDGLLTGAIIRRDGLGAERWPAWLPLAAAAFLTLGALFLPLGGVFGLAVLTFLGLIGFAGINLAGGTYLVPIQTMTSVTATAVGLAGLWAYLRYYGIRRQMGFAKALRQALSQCNTLAEVETLTRQLCQAEFGGGSTAFGDFDRELYDAATDANAGLALLDKRRQQPAPVLAGALPSALTTALRPRGLARTLLRGRGIRAELAIEGKLGRLGTVRLDLNYKAHEAGFLGNLLDILQVEVAQHWHRIKLLVDQKLADFRYLREQTRGEIMSRFLTKALVAKFSDGRTMEENLRLVLNPRPNKAALLQADIRGYSRISALLAPAEMVRLLQSYFRNVVDAAQTVAQVKLIGDCIFLFIEAEAAPDGCSPADLALELAAILVAETEAQNARRRAENGEELHFGIAVHYGDVVVGNLSSDSCIDYTVIGPNVNLVARLEELTKSPKVAAVLGTNGIVISQEAAAGLVRYRHLPLLDLQLAGLGAQVRSFPQVTAVAGMTAVDSQAAHPALARQSRIAS